MTLILSLFDNYYAHRNTLNFYTINSKNFVIKNIINFNFSLISLINKKIITCQDVVKEVKD